MAIFEGQFSPLGNLALFDPLLAQPQPDWPPNSRVCGSPLFDDADDDLEALDELERFLAAGTPPIVFALGSSVVWLAESFWDHAIAAATALGRRAILVTGNLDRPRLPAGIQAFPYLPYSKVFPRAAAVVHQAGIGTLAQALRSGRPQLIVPVAFDQPDNALRAARLGNARILAFHKIDTPRLTKELAVLLKEDRYASAALRVARTLENVDGSGAAADALEGLVNATVAR
jgi:UDP:flavonoid glycosyltransferase YjiC (YdhE family)